MPEETMKTDAQLQMDVSEQLMWEPAVHASQIGVAVKNGVVRLTGQVSSLAEKWYAGCAAQRVVGVCALAVELTTKPLSFGERSDANIARSAEDLLQCSVGLPRDAIRVAVESGLLTLSGEVAWQYQKNAAVDAVRFLLGVTEVSDQIAVKPPVSVGAVTAQIEAALRRGAAADAIDLEVEVDGADATFNGTVHSWPEQDAATDSAWGAAGVRKVLDKMTLAY
jgi:osmotically-inducible protein OsmY